MAIGEYDLKEGFVLNMEDVCVFIAMEMIHREKQFQDIGHKGDNRKNKTLKRQESPESEIK